MIIQLDRHLNAVQCSPYQGSRRLAVAGCSNYGIVGRGRVFVIDTPINPINPINHNNSINNNINYNNNSINYNNINSIGGTVRWFDTPDAVLDVTWSQRTPSVFIASCADGRLLLFNCSHSNARSLSLLSDPVELFHSSSSNPHINNNGKFIDARNGQKGGGRGAEVCGVDWNLIDGSLFLSTGREGTVKIWSVLSQSVISTIPINPHTNPSSSSGTGITGNPGCGGNEAIWSPHSRFGATLLATACTDGHLRIFDIRSPVSKSRAQVDIEAHIGGGECLSLDWSKYDDVGLVSGGSDALVKCWDIRHVVSNVGGSVRVLNGHGMAVKRVRTSPFDRNIVASVGYDMSLKLWNISSSPHLESGLVTSYEGHSEFVMGLDWSNFVVGECVTCSWDQTVRIINMPVPPPHGVLINR